MHRRLRLQPHHRRYRYLLPLIRAPSLGSLRHWTLAVSHIWTTQVSILFSHRSSRRRSESCHQKPHHVARQRRSLLYATFPVQRAPFHHTYRFADRVLRTRTLRYNLPALPNPNKTTLPIYLGFSHSDTGVLVKRLRPCSQRRVLPGITHKMLTRLPHVALRLLLSQLGAKPHYYLRLHQVRIHN